MSLELATDDLRSSFKLAMRRFPAAVTVITSADQTRRHGMTATAVTSLSMDPPSLVVCVNQASLLHDIMLLARRFCVNLLRRDQVALSAAFSGALSPETRFGLGDWAMSPEGISYLETAQINIFCRKAPRCPTALTDLHRRGRTREGPRSNRPANLSGRAYCFSVPADIEAA